MPEQADQELRNLRVSTAVLAQSYCSLVSLLAEKGLLDHAEVGSLFAKNTNILDQQIGLAMDTGHKAIAANMSARASSAP